MTRKPKAMLIDLDDTIIDYGGSAAESWRVVCREEAATEGFDPDSLFAAIDRVRHWYWSDPERHRQGRADLQAATLLILEHALAEIGHGSTSHAAQMAASYREHRWRSIKIIPGAHETLDRLRREGFRMALVTNGTSADQRAKIERFELAPYFDHIQVEGEFGKGKPEPEVYRAVLAALDCAPSEAWFIGDNLEWDVAAPQRQGIYGVWIDRHGSGVPTDRDVQPDHIIRALPELPRFEGQ